MLVSKTKPCTCKIGIGFNWFRSVLLIVNLWTAHYNSYTLSHWYDMASANTRITLSNAAIILERRIGASRLALAYLSHDSEETALL